MENFKAIRVDKTNGSSISHLTELSLEGLTDGEVVIKAQYSSLNYKDALAVTGTGKILRTYPLNAGIDVAGEIVASEDSSFARGDKVVITGCGLSETLDGGYSQFVRVPANIVVALPQQLSLRESMVLGTAGFTAALCIHRMETNGQSPDRGQILVTGASGGVGSLVTNMLSQSGYEVVAVSDKKDAHAHLHKLGAREITTVADLNILPQPLGSARWAGAVDNVGGDLLARVLSHIDLWGNVASVGLAGGAEFETTVMPFILRGVSLLGISSANAPMPLRRKIWERLASDLKPSELGIIDQGDISLAEVPEKAQEMLNRQTIGRFVVSLW